MVPRRSLMGPRNSSGISRYFPHSVVATSIVVLIPAVLVWRLAAAEAIVALLPLSLIGILLATLLGYVGNIAWRSRAESTRLSFPDLMLWGWIRRLVAERRLDSALQLLDLNSSSSPTHLHPDVQIDVLKSLASSLELRDPYTHGHSRRVARYAAMIAARMDLPAEQIQKVRTAAAVHDVGKLEVPLEILNKPGRLTDEEFDVIKTHAPRGAEMVRALGDPELTEMVAHHHERLDGSGYPSRLGGAEIPLGARIIAVADTFDALTSTRAYRPARRQSEALGIIHAEAGTQLDPLVVGAFDRCFEDILGGLFVWPLLVGLPHRILAPLGSQTQVAGGAALSKAFVVVATTAAAGGIVIGGGAPDPRDTSTNDPVVVIASAELAGGSGQLEVSDRPARGVRSSSNGRAAGGASSANRAAGNSSKPENRPAPTSDAGGAGAASEAVSVPPDSEVPTSDQSVVAPAPALPDVAKDTIESVSSGAANGARVPTVAEVPTPPAVPDVPPIPKPEPVIPLSASAATSGNPDLPKP